jgi:curved DNA-binding protein CbpA
MIDHYQTLGVPPDATSEQIKLAYQQLASSCHPDKGGTPEAFAELQAAYAVLSDPARRKQYDETGDGTLRDEAQEAQTVMVAAFVKAIDDQLNRKMQAYQGLQLSQEVTMTPIVACAKQGLVNRNRALKAGCKKAKEHIKKTEALRDKVISRTPDNLFEGILNQKIAKVQSEIDSMTTEKNINEVAINLLEDYEDKKDDSEINQTFNAAAFMGSNTASTT